jgi:hypothetical protein
MTIDTATIAGKLSSSEYSCRSRYPVKGVKATSFNDRAATGAHEFARARH